MSRIRSLFQTIVRLLITWIVVVPLLIFVCMGQMIIAGSIPVSVFDILGRYFLVFVAGASFWAILEPRFKRWWKEMRG